MNYISYIAKYYSELFKPKYEKIKNIEKLLGNIPKSTLLDLGCGAGEHIKMLEKQGHKVYGIDNSKEMVEQAKEQMEGKKKEQIKVGDIQQPYPFEYNLNFDGIYCIGNTLPHLENLDQIYKALSLAFQRLNYGGRLLIQIINYDKQDILNKEFPVLSTTNKKVKFHRKYLASKDNAKNKITFKTTLEIIQDNGRREFLEDFSELFMLKRKDLELTFREAGFNTIKFFSDFYMTPWNYNKDNTIAIAVKR